MRIATFTLQGERRVGLVDVGAATIAPLDLPLERAALGAVALIGAPMPRALSPIPLARVTLAAPIPRPARNLFCVGKNYHDHAAEFAASGFDSSAAQGAVPAHPIVFSKLPESVIATGAAIEIDPAVSSAIDYEAELAVVIGSGGRGISRARAMDHVWGYTCLNDVTARDLQGRHSQWLIGKSQDSFCPMGPWVATADEVDLASMRVRCLVNGETRQDAAVADLIFDVATLIETISAGITLMAGDVIATGTPAGVGIGFRPPRYLAPGDVVRVEIDGIGALENPVTARGAARGSARAA